MAITCPVDLDKRRLRDEIQSIDARVADDPSGEFHFHRGPDYAADLLQYDARAKITRAKITRLEVIGDGARLRELDIATL